jgi:hypothetical protein
MLWFCDQENKLVLTGILPSDEDFQTVGQWLICITGARCSSLESEQRELSNVRDPCDDLTQRKSSKIVNQGPPAFVRHGGLRLGKPVWSKGCIASASTEADSSENCHVISLCAKHEGVRRDSAAAEQQIARRGR